VAKEVFEKMFKENVDPEDYVEKHGLGMVSDDGLLRTTVEKIIAESPQSVADYKSGKTKAMGFIVGQTMKEMKGKADPGKINQLVKEMLDSL
jgi:aspartyl-tRNA(Asn)/glutamyl-tRNA(Gln) amidotransferase subunit B